MARLTRVTHKQFAENAPIVESGNTQVEIGQFGSALAGTYVATNDVATLQALPAYSRGWGGAVIAEEQLPTIEDMNAVQRVQSYQTGYLFQEGIAEYDANSEYGIGSLCKVINGANVKLYQSLINENIGNPITDTNAWQEFTIGGDLFVKKTGDDMTGRLTITSTSYTQLAIKNPNDDRDIAPSTNAGTTGVGFIDKNNKTISMLATERYTDGRNTAKLQAFGKGGSNAPAVRVYAYADGKQGCTFPMCTTKPTTTSTARNDLVAVVTQNYLNGTSWYRVWSDGFIEQGGTVTASSSSTQSITFLKPFTDTNYSLVNAVSKSSVGATNNEVITKSATGFTLQHTDSIQFGWIAKGY